LLIYTFPYLWLFSKYFCFFNILSLSSTDSIVSMITPGLPLLLCNLTAIVNSIYLTLKHSIKTSGTRWLRFSFSRWVWVTMHMFISKSHYIFTFISIPFLIFTIFVTIWYICQTCC
jgi:hypothetical protein